MTHVAEIKQAVAEYFGIRVTDIDGPRRYRTFAWPRHLAYVLSWEVSNLTMPTIARLFGRDPSTLSKSINDMRKRIASDPEWARHYAALKSRLA